ncbi:MAG: hypothetical protein AMJ81_11380 [Phycisphaerae bacterium SM23_33]|nr:MAG: hypothetical protein AMJ81_11380 [Phycisphaerae bacterium SM23_33]
MRMQKASSVVALALLCGLAGGQDSGSAPPGEVDRLSAGGRPQSAPASQPWAAARDKLLEQLSLSLTPEQQAQLRQLVDAQYQAAENWIRQHQKELDDLRAQLAGAASDDQRTALGEKLAKLQAQQRELSQKLHQAIGEAIRPFVEQARQEGARAYAELVARAHALLRLNLPAEQKTRYEKILKDAGARSEQTKNPKEMLGIMRAAHQEVRDKVLTKEQAERFDRLLAREIEFQRMRYALQFMELPREQNARAEKILRDAYTRTEQAKDVHEESAIQRAARQEIRQNVLTGEQAEKFEKFLTREVHGAQSQPAGRSESAPGSH